MNIEITEAAAKRVKELIIKNKKKMVAFRVSVDGGGCSGFMYQYALIEKIKSDDYVLESFDVKVAIDPLSQQFLEGCKIEFIQELGSNFFQITNPNASAKCGCGNSFAV
ncbi:MAG: iron-sulfur cluster insertion protein ErpA [Rickettsiaceae bacterium]|nr:iron-sulfur cluster insertion protein ErpA [Rickettsiaceae bacterium]